MDKPAAKKIIFSGGGSGGPVMPLLAVAEELLRTDEAPAPDLVFVGTYSGPEREMVVAFNTRVAALYPSAAAMKFIPVVSGKFRRYFSWDNFLDIFKISAAYFQSFRILAAERPDLIITAGGFVSVPLVWAAAGRKIPVLVHQQDIRPGLANKLMAPFARTISVTFEKSLADYGSRAVWLGNPVKNLAGEDFARTVADIKNKYGLDGARPLVLVTGGATGSASINKLILAAAPELLRFCRIIHLTGRGKLPPTNGGATARGDTPDYLAKEFVTDDELLALIAAADLVVSRSGLSALTELAALNKPVLLIPIPASHQEDNAAVFARARAAVVLRQADLTPEKLVAEVRRALSDSVLRVELKNNIGKVIKRGAAAALAGIIWEILK
jgi:UDP-N-acetylglucosamine--N-acetylmuramyl-(pentapeptide) pyrophosphoryl-undecaprenol N-acetylglucosamine transferase